MYAFWLCFLHIYPEKKKCVFEQCVPTSRLKKRRSGWLFIKATNVIFYTKAT